MNRASQPQDITEPNLPRRTMVQGAGALVAGALAGMFTPPAARAATDAGFSGETTMAVGEKQAKKKKKGQGKGKTAAGLLLRVEQAFTSGEVAGPGTAMCTATCLPAPAGQRVISMSGSWVAGVQLPVIASFATDSVDGWSHWAQSSTAGKKTYTCGAVCAYFTA